MRATTRFATGNGEIGPSPGSISIAPALRDSVGARWYWHVRLQGYERVRLDVDRRHLGRGGPALSRDGGLTWSWWADPGDELDLTVEGDGGTISLSSTIPYGWVHWQRFASRHLPPVVQSETLARSEEGRPVPAVTVPGDRMRRLVVAARHHACEAASSLVLEGFLLEALRLSDSARPGPQVMAIPLVDIDGVERGDQGKGRRPHDHNRDYGVRCRYASSAAISSLPFASTVASACLDLHTPGIRGPLEERPFLVSSAESADRRAARRLAAGLARRGAGRVPVLIFDGAWNRVEGGELRSFAAWCRSRPGVAFSATVEYPNAVDRGIPISVERAREFGRTLYAAATELLGGG